MKSAPAGLFGLHLIGDALILWLGYAWLSIPESDTAHLLWSLAVVVAFVCSALWLHGTALVYFNRPARADLRHSAAIAFRHLPALIVLVAITLLLYGLIEWADMNLGAPAFQLASWLTLTVRKPVSPERVLAVFHGAVWVVRWWVLPAWLLPAAAGVALGNWGGLRRFGHWPRIWISVKILALVLAGIWAPLKLLAWIPKMPNFGAEMASFLVRGAIAYLLFAVLLLAVERITSVGIPSSNQRSSTAVP